MDVAIYDQFFINDSSVFFISFLIKDYLYNLVMKTFLGLQLFIYDKTIGLTEIVFVTIDMS